MELRDPIPAQHRPPSILPQPVTVQRLLGSLAQSHTCALGQEGSLWASSQENHFSPQSIPLSMYE